MQERVLFVALVLISAYLLRRSGVFGEKDADPFVRYVIYLSLPALVFREVRGVEIGGESLGVVAVAWAVILGSLAVSWCVGKLVRMEERTLRSFMLVSSFGNTAFLGYPFTYALFGEEGLKFAVLYDQIGSFLLVVSVGFLVATGRLSFREVLSFPPFLALALGVITKNLSVPSFLETFLNVVSWSLIPSVLFAIGLRISFRDIMGSLREAVLCLVIKMVLAPLVLLVVLKVLSLKTLGFKVALLETSMPPMVMAGILAMRYNLDDRVAVSSITLGLFLSFLTAPLWVSLL
ncbi:MAG: AEC family transporter [Aquificota bacterium]|nr:AEC family transporter [Aquificota bacterium]